MTKETDIAWLAGIVDGEGCFSVKNPVKRGRGRTCHQVWLVICNTSESMILRAKAICEGLGTRAVGVRKVWKGKKATRWQFWMNIAQKDDLLLVTNALLPHLTAKRVEAAAVSWFLTRACTKKAYMRTALDVAVLETLSSVKRNGGEAPAEAKDLLREVIPNEVLEGLGAASPSSGERVETRRVSSSNTPSQECQAPAAALRVVR